MRTVLYYFTGTGNTLAVSRSLAGELGDTDLVPIPAVAGGTAIPTDADTVGIAFPVYFLAMPDLVRAFVQDLRFSGHPYIFGIATCGERPGGALFGLRALLEEKGETLASGFVFVMPENFIGPVDLMGDAPHRPEKFAAAQARIPAVAAAIRERRQSVPEGNGSALLRIGGAITRALATRLYNTPRHLRSTCRCNRCGTCVRICPTGNIAMEKNGVSWGDACTQCYACIHWCPKGAIEIGRRTAGKPRYHHPDVTAADMLRQREGR